MRMKHFLLLLLLFALFVGVAVAYFYCLNNVPDSLTDIESYIFGVGFFFWPMVMLFGGIVDYCKWLLKKKT